MITNISEEEFSSLLAAIDKQKAERARDMPDERAALSVMFDVYLRLQEMGWRDAMYCPKDASHFAAISAGSTGIHETWYEGKWPDGHWYCFDGGDVWPTQPILFHPDLAKVSRDEQ